METELTTELLEKIDRYINGALSNAEVIAFEKEIHDNENLQYEISLQKQLFNVIGDKNWMSIKNDTKNEALNKLKSQLKSEEFQNVSQLIKKIGKNTNDAQKKNNARKLFLKYALPFAAVFLILISIIVFNSDSKLETLYTENTDWNRELISFVEQSSEVSVFSQGEIAFRNGNFQEALNHFNEIKSDNQLYPYALMYKGAAYELEEENHLALQSFDSLSNLNFEENSKGYWYKLLIYLKLNNKDKAQETLDSILENKRNYKYAKALDISKILE